MAKVLLKEYMMRPEAEMDLKLLTNNGIHGELSADDVGNTHNQWNLGTGIRIFVDADDLVAAQELIGLKPGLHIVDNSEDE